MPGYFVQSIFSARRQPFLYLAAGLIAGILLDRWITPSSWIVGGVAVAIIGASIKFLVSRKSLAATCALIVGFSTAGALLSAGERARETESTLEALYDTREISPDDPVELTGTLVEPPEPAPNVLYLNLEVEKIVRGSDEHSVKGRVKLALSTSDAEARREFAELDVDYGTRIRVLVRLERAKGFANPGAPDFNEFLERQGYDLRGAIKSPLLIERLGDAPRNEALAFLLHLRLRLLSAIDSRFKPPVSGTLKAMLAGNRYFLEPETVERLRQGSTFHTLVIAGLHIGILAWALLGGRSAMKRRKPIRVLSCLAVLWAYAIMVGLAPPVTRATTMITAALIGPLFFRRASSINAVSLAAFAMLALKPALVTDPGFQLSFVAVGGIVALALPLAGKLRHVGEWRPTPHTPHPPSCSPSMRSFAEALFWNDPAFTNEMKNSPIRYRLNKTSVAHTLGIWKIQWLVRGAVLLAITSAAIQLSTLPLMALYFNRASPVGVLLNVVAGLLTGVLMLTGLGTITIGAFNEGVAALLAQVVNAGHYVLVNLIAPFSEIPFATFRVAHYEGWREIVYVLYFIPLALLAVLIDRWQPVNQVRSVDRSSTDPDPKSAVIRVLRLRSPRLRQVPAFVCMLALPAAIIATILPPAESATGKLTVHFLDVGQGDSALILFPRGKTMLVDGGGELRFGGPRSSDELLMDDDEDTDVPGREFSIGDAVVSRFVWSLGRTSVDYLLATHAHADHIGGLSDVLRNVQVGQAIVGHVPSEEPEYERFAKQAHKHRVPLFTVKAGEHFEIEGVSIDVLWPHYSEGSRVTSGNNDSVVLRLGYGAVSLLLAGDLERDGEESLMTSGIDLRADLLKVPHHGSRTSSTEAFIDAVNPSYAVISVGERSRFGHPHQSVVDRYLTRGVRLLQTGRDGMVTAQTDGSSLFVTTYKSH